MRTMVVCLAISISVVAHAQKKIRTVEVSDTIAFATVDRPGDFYIITKSANIQRFNSDGNLQTLYKSKIAPTIFEPRDGSRLFAYFRSTQQMWYMNPSFDITSAHTLDSAFAVEPWLICTSGDYNLWVLDVSDNSLKKIDTKAGVVTVEAAITFACKKESFTYMRDYQGFLFLLDNTSGIHVFNSIGKFIKTIPAKNVSDFNFIGQDLYFKQSDQVVMTDLFSGEARTIKLQQPATSVLLTDEKTFFVNPRSIDIYPPLESH